MHRLTQGLALILLAACVQPPPPPTTVSLRAPGARIYSLAAFDAARLEGRWTQAATFAAGGKAICGPGGAVFAPDRVVWALCLGAGPSRGDGPVGTSQPGRLTVPGLGDLWVLWVDADDRTALIGTPGGGFGFVLNRDGPLPPDRLQAVRDIAVFNGYRAEDLVAF